jgi:hypothetical protein
MKLRLLIATALLFSASARATDVNATVSVGSPDFYGRIEIGTAAKPPVVSPIPVVVTPATVVVERPPIYLRVPPGHAKHWSKHCREYGACSERVFFVEERWYNEVYLPSRQVQREQTAEHPGHGHGHGQGKGHKDG